MNLTPFKSGSCRLLYLEQKALNWDFTKSLAEIDEVIADHPRLYPATGYYCLYFFAPASDPRFKSLLWWFGREIIGFVSPHETSDFKTFDLEAGEGLEVQFCSKVRSLEEIFLTEIKLREEASLTLAETWRIVVPSLFQKNLREGYFLQFFTV